MSLLIITSKSQQLSSKFIKTRFMVSLYVQLWKSLTDTTTTNNLTVMTMSNDTINNKSKASFTVRKIHHSD